METNERKVVHLHLLEIERHEYYGSLTSIYDFHTSEEIGISYGHLKNISKELMAEGKSYSNKQCVIRIGKLRQKQSNRGRKGQGEN